jgi:GT2 family glycosyltransferase
MAKLEIVILSYNRRDFLLQTLEALRSQTCKDFSVLLTDDGSKQLIDPNKYLFIRKYIWDYDFGYHRVAKFNEAISMCRSPYVVLLDDDCVPAYPDFVETHIKTLEMFDVSRGIVRFPDGLTASAWFSTANMGFRTDKLHALGGFDPKFDGSYGHEDRDLGLRVEDAGLSVSPFFERSTVMHLGVDYKNGDRSEAVVGANTKYFRSKWGFGPKETRPAK